jgi:hypothetical protein
MDLLSEYIQVPERQDLAHEVHFQKLVSSEKFGFIALN